MHDLIEIEDRPLETITKTCPNHPNATQTIERALDSSHAASIHCPECYRYLGEVSRNDLIANIIWLEFETRRLSNILKLQPPNPIEDARSIDTAISTWNSAREYHQDLRSWERTKARDCN
ncbi:MAG: hypothetical protein HC778_01255 [Chamaesiphon sp. CSU_1_12]|nr:hypothetical protein [Chamaesiphon sp. CSU_1_12]